MPEFVQFEVLGKPMGKGQPRIVTIRGRAVLAADKATKNEEKRIREHAAKALTAPPWNGQALRGPVKCEVLAVFEVPKSWSKRDRNAALSGLIHCTTKPDCSNIAKLVEDAMNPPRRKAGEAVPDQDYPPANQGWAYLDDAQIIDTRARKQYGEVARIIVRLTALED